MRPLRSELVTLLVWALAVGVLAWQITVPPWGPVAACLGAATGTWLGGRLASGPYRLPWIWLGALAGAAATEGVAAWIRGWSALASVAGPESLYRSVEALAWYLLCILLVAAWRATSERMPAAVLGEAATVAALVASLFAAHRRGLISFPYFLVDPLWARGIHPEPVLVGIGAAVAGLLVLLVAHRRRGRRSAWEGVLLLLFVGAFYLWVPVPMVPRPDVRDFEPPGRGGQGQGSGQGGKDEMVAIVVLHDDYPHPPTGFYYLRQDASSLYNGSRLVRDLAGGRDADVASAFPTDAPVRVEPPAPSPSAAPGLGLRRYLAEKSIDTTIALLRPHSRPFGLVNPEAFEATDNTEPDRFVRMYRARSRVLESYATLRGRAAGDRRWSPETWAHYTKIPPDARYAALAERIVRNAPPQLRGTPLGRALAVKLWLEDNGIYSLRERGASRPDEMDETGPDLVADFLFGNRTGYCVYFAHAACYLYRAVGMPSRVASGYAVNPQFQVGSALPVMDGAAHAWPEIDLEDVGWVVLDIAPKRGDAPSLTPPDPSLVRILTERVRKTSDRFMQPPGQGDLREWLKQILRVLARFALRALGGLILVAYAIKAWRRHAHRWARPSHRLRLAYRATLDRLADLRLVRAHGQTREDFARMHAVACPALGDLTLLHLEEALGRPEAPVPADRVAQLERRACAELRGSSGRIRRVLGLLDPISWWWVR